MLEKDLIRLNNQELIELLATLEEMDKVLEEKEKELVESSDSNDYKL